MEEAIDAYEKILKQDAGNRYAMKRLKEFRNTLEGVKKAAKAKEERQTLKKKTEKEYAVGCWKAFRACCPGVRIPRCRRL